MPRKLIEVALPLEVINREAGRENFIYKGNPSSIHKWWAQRPLAACRAVLFASLVDDPSGHPEKFPTEDAQRAERQRLFRLLEELVTWESASNDGVLARARAEILNSTEGKLPVVFDPFCGGGSIPLEAQRLGLVAHGSDLNPVAVLVSKALVEIPPRFSDRSPVHTGREPSLLERTWSAAHGLAADIRFYGDWVRQEATSRLGSLYPSARLPADRGGGEAPAIAWLWARTVTCPNPACGAQMPLAKSFALSTRKGKETWLEPVVDKDMRSVNFEVRGGKGTVPAGTVGRRGARFVVCESTVPLDHVRSEAKAGRMGARMLAIVAETARARVYLRAEAAHEAAAAVPIPHGAPTTELPLRALGFRVQGYGMTRHADLFTARQLTALVTLGDLVGLVRDRILTDARMSGALPRDERSLAEGGTGPVAYADAVLLALAMAVDKVAEYNCSLVPWYAKEDRPKGVFARQALPIVWDFAEVNPLGTMGGTWSASVRIVAEAVDACPATAGAAGRIAQRDATTSSEPTGSVLVCTDPPYYDNVPYADLSDFFYTWLRRTVGQVFPDVCSTLLVPKAQEIIASAERFGGDRILAERHFEEGLSRAFLRMREQHDPAFPVTVFYAFKQAELDEDDESGVGGARASTGWETMLEGLIAAGFSIVGTWPMRTERAGRMRDLGSNALASSVVLVARARSSEAPLSSRKEFLAALKRELPGALRYLQDGNIAPVDLAQATIGPGMAVYSRYLRVVEADGSRMSVRTALGLINQGLDEVLAELESEFDPDTRFALAWFEQYGMAEGPFGDAETLSRAKDTSVEALSRDGLLEAKRGKVRLRRRDELAGDWSPVTDARLTVWEVTEHLMRRLEVGGESAAADLLKQVGSLGDVARDLAYRLYSLCERKGWAQEAVAYNSLVVAWPELVKIAAHSTAPPAQKDMF